MRKKIFISSTYRDLKIHRAEIWKRIQNLEVDVLGMESFGARKSTPIETCLEEVEKCDIYIGIISMCAGTIHPKFKKSFTHLEYEKAYLLNKDIWIYLIDEHEGVIKTGNIDHGKNLEYLGSFKSILKEKHTIDFFKNERDLGSKIFKKINDILPKERVKTNRPDVLDCRVFKFKSQKLKWVIFIGILNYRPYEIFSGCSDEIDSWIILPRSVHEGKIIRDYDDDEGEKTERYDFQYPNIRGYKTTIEGINFPFVKEISAYDKQISKLFQNNIDIDIIVEVIKEMHAENQDQLVWKKKVIEILQNFI